jgi:hypothetical protein
MGEEAEYEILQSDRGEFDYAYLGDDEEESEDSWASGGAGWAGDDWDD